MAEKTALLAPMPSARVSTTVMEKAGDFASDRSDSRTLRSIASTPSAISMSLVLSTCAV